MPAIAWSLLEGQRDKAATLWFSGTACYAGSATLFVLQTLSPNPLMLIIALSLVALMLCLMYESLRQELAPGSTHWSWIVCFVLGNGIFLFFIQAGYGVHAMRAFQLCIISLCDFICCAMLVLVILKYKSRSLIFVLLAFFTVAMSNLYRMYSFVIFSESPVLINYSAASNIGFIINYLSVVLYSFGYWGFVIEKQRVFLAAEKVSRRIAELGETEAKSREINTLETLRQSDELMERISRLHRAVQAGALSASIAHEISQPLTSIRLAADEVGALLNNKLDRNRLERLVALMIEESRRAGDILQTLRNLFGRSLGAQEGRTVDEILSTVSRLTRRYMKRASAELTVELGAPIKVKLGSGELEQVILNLLNNAVDALSDSYTSSGKVTIASWSEDGYVWIRVADNGPGIPPELGDKIFGLFSGERPGGLGLGLWLSRFIVERYDGKIFLEQQDGKPGTAFLIKLLIAPNEQ